MRHVVGHSRPLGTTRRFRIRWHNRDRTPELGDVACELPVELERAWLVVGVEELRDSPRVWGLVLERIAWENGARRPGELWWWERDRPG